MAAGPWGDSLIQTWAPRRGETLFPQRALDQQRKGDFVPPGTTQGFPVALDLRARGLLFLVYSFLCLDKNPDETALPGHGAILDNRR